MKQISDSDYGKMLRLLKAFSTSQAVTLREQEERRQAKLLLRKWEKRNPPKGRPTISGGTDTVRRQG